MKRTVIFFIIFSLFISSFKAVDLDDYFKTNKVSFFEMLFGYDQDEGVDHHQDTSDTKTATPFLIFILTPNNLPQIDDELYLTYERFFPKEKIYTFLFSNQQLRPPIS